MMNCKERRDTSKVGKGEHAEQGILKDRAQEKTACIDWCPELGSAASVKQRQNLLGAVLRRKSFQWKTLKADSSCKHKGNHAGLEQLTIQNPQASTTLIRTS